MVVRDCRVCTLKLCRLGATTPARYQMHRHRLTKGFLVYSDTKTQFYNQQDRLSGLLAARVHEWIHLLHGYVNDEENYVCIHCL